MSNHFKRDDQTTKPSPPAVTPLHPQKFDVETIPPHSSPPGNSGTRECNSAEAPSMTSLFNFEFLGRASASRFTSLLKFLATLDSQFPLPPPHLAPSHFQEVSSARLKVSLALRGMARKVCAMPQNAVLSVT
ncbi:riboflavin-binding protein-like [Platysternon megacephalum]|uniref:Riboflavin-binding protein-like n=1 Tax=Platysternon megacephalum TaxID=55544 RepID=A0A4D9E107_9SAUR|nr:riboflavin-binding protein-like [Platysternon megacephalum]